MARCYILGAGFSKPFGLPLASELTAQVWNHATRGMDDFGAETRDGWLKMLRIAYPSCDFHNNWPDFEDLITVLDEWESYRADYEGRVAAPGPVQPAHLKKVLLKHLGPLLCEKLSACDNEGLGVVRRFVKQTAEAGHCVVSFNWDLLLEVAAADVDVAVSYGVAVVEGLQVAKPHGSLNLAETSRENFEEAKRSINVHSVTLDFEYGSTVVLRAEHANDAAQRIVNPFGVQATLLVEPTVRKSYQSPWLVLQWRRALNMVREADEIVIIGYSLPATDFRPRILLQAASMSRRKRLRIRVVDPKATELINERYSKACDADYIPVDQPWDEWFWEDKSA